MNTHNKHIHYTTSKTVLIASLTDCTIRSSLPSTSHVFVFTEIWTPFIIWMFQNCGFRSGVTEPNYIRFDEITLTCSSSIVWISSPTSDELPKNVGENSLYWIDSPLWVILHKLSVFYTIIKNKNRRYIRREDIHILLHYQHQKGICLQIDFIITHPLNCIIINIILTILEWNADLLINLNFVLWNILHDKNKMDIQYPHILNSWNTQPPSHQNACDS